MSGAQTLWICPPLFKSSRSNVEAVVMFEHAGVAMELVPPKFMVPKAAETTPPVALTTLATGGGGGSAKCEVMGFCLKLATWRKKGGVTPFARN